MTRLTELVAICVAAVTILGGCLAAPATRQNAATADPDTLVIGDDGSMRLNDRPIPNEDVIIYNDGRGGERAAVRIRMEPLHPDFFRDTILVERE